MTGIRADVSLTTLDDFLTLVPNLTNKYLPDQDPQEDYLKVWKFFEENSNPEVVRSLPIPVQDCLQFKRHESYLFLFLQKLKNPRFFPPDLFKDLQNTTNLTPKGIKTPFVLSKKHEIEFSIFIGNGKNANPLLKAIAQTRAFELENHLNKYPSVLTTLFSGVYIKSKKLQKSETVFFPYSNQKLFHEEFLIWNKHEKNGFFKYFYSAEPGKLFMNPYGVTLHKPKMSSLSLKNVQNKLQEKESIPLVEDIKELEDMDIRDTTRNELKLEFYNEKLSQVAEGVFVSGESAAKNKSLLLTHNITHIINCSGNISENCFPHDFTYSKLFIKDSSSCNIECLLYQIIETIDGTLESGGKVLVHCIQGVSRSVSLCIGYLIFKQQRAYEEVLANCKSVREICSPNIGFQVQLIWWYKRLFEPFTAIPLSPRLFLACSYDKDQPGLVVVKLLMTNFNTLDPRGYFLVYSEKSGFMWKGIEVPEKNKKNYKETCLSYSRLLQKYEKCSEIVEVEQGNEPEGFWEMWKDDVKVQRNSEWDQWLVEIEESEKYSSISSEEKDLNGFQESLSDSLHNKEEFVVGNEMNIEILSVRSVKSEVPNEPNVEILSDKSIESVNEVEVGSNKASVKSINREYAVNESEKISETPSVKSISSKIAEIESKDLSEKSSIKQEEEEEKRSQPLSKKPSDKSIKAEGEENKLQPLTKKPSAKSINSENEFKALSEKELVKSFKSKPEENETQTLPEKHSVRSIIPENVVNEPQMFSENLLAKSINSEEAKIESKELSENPSVKSIIPKDEENKSNTLSVDPSGISINPKDQENKSHKLSSKPSAKSIDQESKSKTLSENPSAKSFKSKPASNEPKILSENISLKSLNPENERFSDYSVNSKLAKNDSQAPSENPLIPEPSKKDSQAPSKNSSIKSNTPEKLSPLNEPKSEFFPKPDPSV